MAAEAEAQLFAIGEEVVLDEQELVESVGGLEPAAEHNGQHGLRAAGLPEPVRRHPAKIDLRMQQRAEALTIPRRQSIDKMPAQRGGGRAARYHTPSESLRLVHPSVNCAAA